MLNTGPLQHQESLTPQQLARAERFGIDPLTLVEARKATSEPKSSRRKQQFGKKKGARGGKFKGNCRNCGKKGHKAAECRSVKGKRRQSSGGRQNNSTKKPKKNETPLTDAQKAKIAARKKRFAM